MQEQTLHVRAELYRLLLDEEAGVACNLVPRMLADPESLTPEIRWCVLYLVRGIRYLAARNMLLGEGTILDTVVEDFEVARLHQERLDWLWFTGRWYFEKSGVWSPRLVPRISSPSPSARTRQSCRQIPGPFRR
jgi:hypothetical protein